MCAHQSQQWWVRNLFCAQSNTRIAHIAKLNGEAMEMLREGDTLVVWKLDRLGRKRQMTDGKIESAKKMLANGVPPRDTVLCDHHPFVQDLCTMLLEGRLHFLTQNIRQQFYICHQSSGSQNI